jgi:hypothetical protein
MVYDTEGGVMGEKIAFGAKLRPVKKSLVSS